MIKIDYDRQRDGQSVYENYIGALQEADKTRIVWFSPTGNDTTGAGTVANPYQTRAKANSETSAAKPYALLIEDFYIPGYTDNNIVYLDTVSGNDSNDGSTELLAKLTYASAATAASTTKKIRVINDGVVLDVDITKPTEAKAGIVASIQGDLTVPVDTFGAIGTPSFSTTDISSIGTNGNIIVAAGSSGKIAYSYDGDTFVQSAALTGTIVFVGFVRYFNKFIACNSVGSVWSSSDGITWSSLITISGGIKQIAESNSGIVIAAVGSSSGSKCYRISDNGDTWDSINIAGINGDAEGVAYSESVGKFVLLGYYTDSGGSTITKIFNSTNGTEWNLEEELASGVFGNNLVWSEYHAKYIFSTTNSSLKLYSSSDGSTWSISTDNISNNQGYILNVTETGAIIGLKSSTNGLWYSYDLDTVSDVTTAGLSGKSPVDGIYVTKLGKSIIVCSGGHIIASASYDTDISKNVAGFTINACTYTSSPTLYNCSTNALGSTNSVSTNKCKNLYEMVVDGDSQTHFRTISDDYIGVICTPASQNAVTLDSITCDNELYIFNSSQTGYELIRDCIIENGVRANYLISVLSGNVRGTSNNAVLGSSVGNSNPILDDDGRPNRPWIPNGSGTESPVIAVAKYSTNSDGVKNDLGCFIVNDEDVGYTYKKSKYLPSGSLKIGKGIESSEQVGDDGEVDVFGNPQRAVEVVLINYESLSPEDTAFVDELDELNDYHVRLNLYPSTQIVTGSVTVNGNQSSGAFTLAVDATAIHPGATLTIGGVEYYILYASPNYTAATTLVLNKPLESNVLDNDVITTSYPAGYGEYSYSPKSRELQLSVAQSPSAYFINVALRFIRKWQS